MGTTCPCGTDHSTPPVQAPVVPDFVARMKSPHEGVVAFRGMQIENFVRGFTYHAAVGEIPSVVLELPIRRGTDVQADRVNARIAEDSRELLQALGWTPPEGRSKDASEEGRRG